MRWFVARVSTVPLAVDEFHPGTGPAVLVLVMTGWLVAELVRDI